MFKRTVTICLFVFAFQFSKAQSAANINQAMYYFDSGNYTKARELYQQLYQDAKYREIIYSDYINTLIKLGEFDEAEKIIKRRIKESNTPDLDRLKLGFVYKAQNRVADSQKVFDDLVKNLSPDPYQISQIASNFYSNGDLQMALRTFMNGRLALKDENQFTFELINIYRFLKNKEGLIAEVLKAIKIQPDYLHSAKTILSSTLESDEDYQLLKTALLRQVQKNPEELPFVELLAWTYVQLEEYSMALIQTIALDKRTNDNGSRVFALSGLLVNNDAWDEAQRGYNYLVEKGADKPYYVAAKVQLLKVRQQQTQANPGTADFASLAQSYQELIDDLGNNARTLFAVKELAKIQAKKLDQPVEAQQNLEQALRFNGLKQEDLAEIKLDLADIYLINGNPWDAELVLSQIEKALPNHPLAQEARFKNARISFYNGDFKWAKSQLDVLKASTSQLIANDALDLSLLIQDNMQQDTSGNALKIYARAEFLRELGKNQQALQTLDSIMLQFPQSELTDDILLSKGRIFVSQNQVSEAMNSYKELYTAHPSSIWADDAIFHSARILEEKLNDKEQAKQLYQRLIDEYSGSFYIEEARKSYRKLRGDAL